MTLTTDDKKWIKDAITEGVVDALNEIVIPRFDEHDKRFDEHDRRFDEHDRRFDAIEADVAELKTDVAELKTDVAELKTDVGELKNDMRIVKSTLMSLDDRIQLLEADVKSIYYMISDLQKQDKPAANFAKLPLEKKILKTYADVLAMAKEAGVSLPRP